MTLLAVGVMAACWTVPAGAGIQGITTRKDPNDTSSVLDIRRVGSVLSRRLVYLGVGTWDPFTANDLMGRDNSFFKFLLDTKRRGRADKLLFMFWDDVDARFECDLYNRDGGFKGQRPASTNSTSIACVTPRKWYDIEKQVQFGVEAYELGILQDRAPNNGRYRGL